MLATILRAESVLDADEFTRLVRSKDVEKLTAFIQTSFNGIVPAMVDDTEERISPNDSKRIDTAYFSIKQSLNITDEKLCDALYTVVQLVAVIRTNNEWIIPGMPPRFDVEVFITNVYKQCQAYAYPPVDNTPDDHLLYRNEIRPEDRPQRLPEQIAKPHVRNWTPDPPAETWT